MSGTGSVLISLEKRHAENILSGAKRVELRRRSMNVIPGTTVWLYAKVPVGSIIGSAVVRHVHQLSPTAIWKQFGPTSGLSRRELYRYFDGAKQGFVLELTGAQRLRSSLSLDSLRRLSATFQPPQFFIKISRDHPIYDAVNSLTA
jgi:predicted transcriptional regulator